MNPDHWRVVEELFQHASDLPADDRQAYLRQACGTNRALLEEVESLLSHGAKSESVLDTPAITVIAKDIAADGQAWPAPLSEGQSFSHYRILKAIGQGGMGVVYAAEDTKLRRRVALKLLPMFMASSPQALRRFEREAQAASALNHPNICTVYEINEAEGLHFIAIELLEGETVKQRIARGSIQAPEILAVGEQICDALEAAHSAGIVHRDIKPSNIFITQHGTAKLLDFGVAKRFSSGPPSRAEESLDLLTGHKDLRVTHATGAVGTIAYMSPEQASGQPVDDRSDLFSLGAVLYEMTTGNCPFPGKDPAEVIQAIHGQDPVPIEQLNSKAPPELIRITRKALHKNPAKRYQRAAEMRQDLQALHGHFKHRIGKHRAWFVLASAIASIALMIAVFVGVGRVRGRMPGNSSSPAPEIKSLAVLPLSNLTGDSSQEYFVDGMTDALTTNLTKLRSVRVISRTSAMHYKGTNKTIPEIARELTVNAVLEGSVVRSRNRVRIAVQLTDARTAQNLWSRDYERDLQDVLQLQNEIAMAVATEIAGTLVPQDEKRLPTPRIASPDAYEAYLRGRHFAEQGSPKKSLEYFQQAIHIDPNYAPAYSGLADVYVTLGVGEDDADQSYELALQAVTKALSLDDSLAEAHASLAFVLHRFKQDWQGAEKEFKRSRELNPNYSVGRLRYGIYLQTLGRPKAGCEQIRLAHSLDPVSPLSAPSYARCLYENGQFNEAVQTLTLSIEMNPKDEVDLRRALGEIYERKKMYPEAVAEYEQAIQHGGRTWLSLAFLASGYASWGKNEEAEKVLAELRQKFGDDSYVDAGTHAAMGQKEQAIRELVGDGTCSTNGSSPGMSWLRINWRFDSIRSDPRYKALERCAHYPDPE